MIIVVNNLYLSLTVFKLFDITCQHEEKAIAIGLFSLFCVSTPLLVNISKKYLNKSYLVFQAVQFLL